MRGLILLQASIASVGGLDHDTKVMYLVTDRYASVRTNLPREIMSYSDFPLVSPCAYEINVLHLEILRPSTGVQVPVLASDSVRGLMKFGLNHPYT